MVYAWLDENNPEGVRQLIIRDLLRQSYDENNPAITYHQTKHGFGRLLHFGGGYKSKELYWTLRNRPHLLEEIVSELIYNLEYNYFSTKMLKDDSFCELLELLFTVVKGQN